MSEMLRVKAAPGLRLPKEGKPREYITDQEPEEVSTSHYYRKALADGDLIAVPRAPEAKGQKGGA